MKGVAVFALLLATLACGGTAAPTAAPAGPLPTPYQDCNERAVDNWLETQTDLLEDSRDGWDRFTGSPDNSARLAVEAEVRYRHSLAVFAPDCLRPVAQNQTDSFYEEWQFFLAVSREDFDAADLHMARIDELFNYSDRHFGSDWFDLNVIPRLDP